MSEHECRVHYEPDDHRAPIVNDAPAGWTPEGWHADATADTNTSHVRVGPRYVIACQWCRCVFIAPTKKEAMTSFRKHEAEMSADPGPTTVERLETVLSGLYGALREAGIDSSLKQRIALAESLDGAGVTAPGGEGRERV
ncbi:hypothetical protein GCM10009700_31890 [Brevibacterium sanguinis]|uniref:hypothetical protein n=1 Tax=Brevibacterium sanguinis TaxID=232444 RepID=UPI0031D3543C